MGASVVVPPSSPARPRSSRVATPGARPSARPPRFDLSPRAYRLLVAATIAAYLVLWLLHFQYVYGWLMDDFTVEWTKGMATVRDWKHAFDVWNALQLSFFLITYLPLKLPVSLPSYPLPILGEDTGHFRFLLLYTVFLHAGLLALWAWFAAALGGSRLAAFLSLVLFATSPTLLLWTPQPESRLLGLPFVLVGVRLLLRLGARAQGGWRQVLGYGVVGSLFGLAQAIHYTALYLTAPLAAVYWLLRLREGWRRRETWLGAVAFGLGGLWLHGVLEALSHFGVGLPWDEGLTATLTKLRAIHASPWGVFGTLSIWVEGFVTQMGLPLLVAVALGWALYLRAADGSERPSRHDRFVIGLGVALGLLYLWLSGTMPFFRQTSVLQPFHFLFAAVGIVAVAQRLTAVRGARRAAIGGLVALLGVVPWVQASSVFQAHQSLGRALEWAYTHKGDRAIAWLPIAWFGSKTDDVLLPEELDRLAPDTWIMSYFPVLFVDTNPTLLPAFADAPAVAAWPSLYATDTLRVEHKGYGYNDFRADPLLRDIRIVEAGALRQAVADASLAVESVTADSVAFPSAEPANVFDRDRSPDGVTAWISASGPGPHTLEIKLAAPAAIGALDVVLPQVDQTGKKEFREQTASRIATLAIQAADARGDYRTVWAGDGLERHPVVRAVWPPVQTDRLRVVIERQPLPTRPADWATIEEIAFPGYRVVAPPPSRAFPDLVLRRALPGEKGLAIAGGNISPHTVVYLNGAPLPTRSLGKDRLLGQVPIGQLATGQEVAVYLSDGVRQSNAVTLNVQPPVLERVQPAATLAGRQFNVQPDGSSALSLDTRAAGPGTTVLFDGAPLVTAYGSEEWLTAAVPRGLLARPGRHRITLKNLFGESNALEFEVTERPPPGSSPPPLEAPPISGPLPGPLVLQKVAPTQTRVGQAFNRQPDDQSALSLDVQNALPGTVVIFGDEPLSTTFGNDHWLTAIVPVDRIQQPGRYEVYLKYGTTESNRLEFVVER